MNKEKLRSQINSLKTGDVDQLLRQIDSFEYPSSLAQERAVVLCKNFVHGLSEASRYLKHDVESRDGLESNYLGVYISEGTLIQALLDRGFQCATNGHNAWFKIKDVKQALAVLRLKHEPLPGYAKNADIVAIR